MIQLLCMEKKCKFCNKTFKSRYQKQIFCCLACSNRFNLNNKNSVRLPRRYSVKLAELFGILLGDGSVTKYFVKVYLNRKADAGYADYINDLCKKLFPGASVSQFIREKRGLEEIQLSSKDVSDYLYKIGFSPKKRKIPKWIKSDSRFVKAVIRGLFDTEGCMGIKYFEGKSGKYFYKQLTFTNKNKNLLTFVENQLRFFNYRPTKKSQKNIYISNSADISRYFREIGSSNPKLIKKLNIAKIGEYKMTRRVAPNGKAAVLKTAVP